MASEEQFHSSTDEENDSETEQEQTKGHLNRDGLVEILEGLKSNLDWIENLSVTVNMDELELPASDLDRKNIGGSVHDDFRRELGFYCQAQAAAKEALGKLRDLNIPTQRPDDYFAEMVKTDTHMQKVRSRLQSIKTMKENAEKKRKMRQMKKFGKKVQQEVLEKRKEEKKQMLKEVGRIRKGKRKLNADDGDDIFNVKTDPAEGRSDRTPNVKRKNKNEKYGFGGKKRQMKKNKAFKVGDSDGFNPAKHGKGPRGPKQKGHGGQKKKPIKRLGKARRAKQKMKKK